MEQNANCKAAYFALSDKQKREFRRVIVIARCYSRQAFYGLIERPLNKLTEDDEKLLRNCFAYMGIAQPFSI